MGSARVSRTVSWKVLIGLALVLALAALPASAQNLRAGLDLFTSQQGSAVDFSNNPLPSGFFPGCGSGFNGSISLTGAPIAASKNLGQTDTIVSRLDPTVFNGSGQGSTRLQITALCLKNNAWADPCGHTWKVSVRLDPSATQPIGGMAIQRTGAQGGTFGSSFSVLGEVSFTDGSTSLGPVADSITLTTTSACWSYTPGTPSVSVAGPVTVDTDCDGTPETVLPGTSNFHAGWCPGPSGPTWTPVTHDGPHPVGPAKPCPTPAHDDVPAASGLKAAIAPAPVPQPICAEPLPVEPKVIND